jgi:hypothetical protein
MWQHNLHDCPFYLQIPKAAFGTSTGCGKKCMSEASTATASPGKRLQMKSECINHAYAS